MTYVREQRKKELLNSFPGVPQEIMNEMLDCKCAKNFVVLLTRGQELYARCFHRYSKERVLAERQRYVFAKDGAVRYGESYDEGTKRWLWRVRRDFREPVFYINNMGYHDNRYRIMDSKAILFSDLRYFQIPGDATLYLEWLRLFCKHPNVEYLIKTGYRHLIREICSGYWGSINHLETSCLINWKSNNLLKMLGLNRTEFKLLQGNEENYECYKSWRRVYPKAEPQELMKVVRTFGSEQGTAASLTNYTGKSVFRIAAYLEEKHVTKWNYRDYISQCRTLEYDLHDTAICFPKDFEAMHTRLSAIIKYKTDEKKNRELTARIPEREKFEFSYKDLILIQPKNLEEIITEGRTLHHCVGGYADRHAEGETNIFFIRKASDPDTPYFTIEVNNNYYIQQCHGFKNDVNGKPVEIDQFEKAYQNYLEELKYERDHKKRAVQDSSRA